MPPLLEVQGLEIAFYTKNGVVRAVNDISYTLDQGDTLGIVGESGSGKSVSALAMLRLLPEPPARILGGKVLLEGRDVLALPRHELHTIRGGKIAMVFQDPMTSLNPVMTIGDQIGEAVRINLQLSARAARARTLEVLAQVGIPNPRDRSGDYPHQFSGGQRQRVMIAMAISCGPKLLIADEPTTALDVTIQAQIVDLIKRLQADLRMAVIWITHDLGVVARIARRVNVMYAGSIVESGPISDIFAHPGHPYTIGLIASVPKAGMKRDEQLRFIEGSPPDLSRLPEGCAFAPRCEFRTAESLAARPALREVGPGHFVACCNVEAVRLHQRAEVTRSSRAATVGKELA